MKWLIGILSVLVVAASCAAVIVLTGWQILPADTSDTALAEEVAHIEVAPAPAEPDEAAVLAQCIRDIQDIPLPDMSDWNQQEMDTYNAWLHAFDETPYVLDNDGTLDAFIRHDLTTGTMSRNQYQYLMLVLCN